MKLKVIIEKGEDNYFVAHCPSLKRLGFMEVHRKGSHVKMKHPDGRIIVFPDHHEVDRYTLKGALKDAEG